MRTLFTRTKTLYSYYELEMLIYYTLTHFPNLTQFTKSFENLISMSIDYYDSFALFTLTTGSYRCSDFFLNKKFVEIIINNSCARLALSFIKPL